MSNKDKKVRRVNKDNKDKKVKRENKDNKDKKGGQAVGIISGTCGQGWDILMNLEFSEDKHWV